MSYKLLSISESPRKEKKFVAIFINKKTGVQKTTHFGAKGMSDFTIHKDPKRKQRYIVDRNE